MHFFVLKENLSKFLCILGRNISTHPQLPILSNILLKAEKGQLITASTNLELGILFTIPAKIEKEGEITIPGRLLTDFISSLIADKIEFFSEGTNILVKTSKSRASFTTMPSTDFPMFPNISQTKNAFPFEKIKNTLNRIVFAASVDEGRPVLTGVKTNISQGKMTFVATDGYRLSKEQVEIEDKKINLNVILPAQSLAEMVRIATELKAEEIKFAIIEDKNQAVFILPQGTIFTRLIDGEFPNIEKIIPVAFKTKVIIETPQFASAVKTTSLFARSAANIIKIKIEKEGLRLKAVTPQLGEDEEFVEAKVEGEESEISFNYRFLLDLLSNFPEEQLVFETTGPLNPGVFRPLSSSLSFLHLIMPIRVQE